MFFNLEDEKKMRRSLSKSSNTLYIYVQFKVWPTHLLSVCKCEHAIHSLSLSVHRASYHCWLPHSFSVLISFKIILEYRVYLQKRTQQLQLSSHINIIIYVTIPFVPTIEPCRNTHGILQQQRKATTQSFPFFISHTFNVACR